MLELRHVTKSFSGIPAVDDVSFTARAGEVTGYLGPNGSGKSTTMKMITGLIRDDLGRDPVRRRAASSATRSPTSSAWATCRRSRIFTRI